MKLKRYGILFQDRKSLRTLDKTKANENALIAVFPLSHNEAFNNEQKLTASLIPRTRFE